MSERGFEEVPCNLCGKNDFMVVFNESGKREPGERAYSASSTAIAKERVVKCKNCGLIYVNPRPSAKKIIDEYSGDEDEAYISQAQGRMESFRPITEEIERACGKKGSLLDVGCAAGFLLAAAKERGWKTRGVEPNKWLGKWGSKKFGIPIDQGVLEGQKYPSKSFDAVSLFDVLEHVPDPSKTLSECRRILKDDGVLLINYPNIGSVLAKIAGKNWWFLLSIHLTYFTPKTLEKMLEKEGFVQVKSKKYFGRLSIGYLVSRVKPYNHIIYGVLDKAAKASGLDKKQFTYYASQQIAIARKKQP